jgi:hypothetical protein
MNSRERAWACAIGKALGYDLMEHQALAVAKVVGDIHWDAMEDAATICEDNGDEASADDIHNMQDATWLTVRQKAIADTRREVLEEVREMIDDAMGDWETLASMLRTAEGNAE